MQNSFQRFGLTLYRKRALNSIYLNQVIETMMPSFSSPYLFGENYNLYLTNSLLSFHPLTPYVYLVYDPPFMTKIDIIKTENPGNQVQNFISTSEQSLFARCISKQPSLQLEKPIDFKCKNKEQNKKEHEKFLEQIKQEEKTQKIINQKENQLYKPEESRFVKKNTESNIVSQIFSFLWSPDKNHQSLTAILRQTHKIKVFEALMKSLKNKCRSQLNRDYLKRLMIKQEWPISFRKLKSKIRRNQELPQEELESVFRKLSFLYLRQKYRCSILTSKKMNKKLWGTHFQKCSEIREFLFHKKQD